MERPRYSVVTHPRSPDESKTFAANIMHFARALRRAGLPIGTGRIIDALAAVDIAGLRSRDEFYWALHSLFVSGPEQRLIFDQGFRIFWQRPELLEELLTLNVRVPGASPDGEGAVAGSRRLSEAMSIARI